MVCIKNVIFLAATAAAAVVRRDVVTVFTDLQTIDAATQNFTSTVTNWNGQLFSALQIESVQQTLQKDIEQATTDTNALTDTVTDAEAEAVINYISATLEPDVGASIDALIAKKAQFQSLGITGIVTSGLSSVQKDTDALSSALQAKAPADQTAAAQAAAASIDAQFARGQAAFAS